MIRLGERQTLKCIKKVDFGIYVGDGSEERVLLPKKQVPENMEQGKEIDVFVYRDSSDRLIATTRQPYITLGELAVLEVKSIGKIGAFLDWGLEKDLFLPFKEQTGAVSPGKSYLVALYIDKSNRLAATMKIHGYLTVGQGYQKDDRVAGTIYEIHREWGAFVAVQNRYYGLLPQKEIHTRLSVGDYISARVTEVRNDGKLNLSLQQKAYMQMDEDCVKVLKVIGEYEGELPYGEKVSPEIIARDFEMSKAAFKRAVGRLYKARKVEIGENSIRIIDQDK